MKVPLVPAMIFHILRFAFKAYIPITATIGRGSFFGYGGTGVALHPGAVIGERCVIGQNCMILSRDGGDDVPVLGNGVLLGAGSAIVGPIIVGDNVKVGANAVVMDDVPPNSVVVGIPARVIKPDRG